MIGVSFLCLLFSIDGRIGQFDGLVLFAGGIAYTVFLIVQSRRETNAEVQQEYEQEYGQEVRRSPQSLLVNIGFIAIGLVMLVWGSRWLVEGAKSIALAIGWSDLIVGLTIVAAGTSLPELATSAIASLRGERDIAVGNVVGSNIFNILAVLGLSAAISPSGIAVAPAVLHFDLPVMLAVAIICLPIFFTGNLISRGEGLLFLGYYLAYMLYLLMAATQHESLSAYSSLLLFAVIPLTVLLLGFSTWQATRRRRLLLAKRREAED
jgi:cation:H+ antiporter